MALVKTIKKSINIIARALEKKHCLIAWSDYILTFADFVLNGKWHHEYMLVHNDALSWTP